MIKIVLISGKPAIYLCGFVRQLGLSDITVVGENGAEIYYDANVPPSKTFNNLKLKIKEFLNRIFELKEYSDNLEIYEHVDCFDIIY